MVVLPFFVSCQSDDANFTSHSKDSKETVEALHMGLSQYSNSVSACFISSELCCVAVQTMKPLEASMYSWIVWIPLSYCYRQQHFTIA